MTNDDTGEVVDLTVIEPKAVAVLESASIETQIATARKYPRTISHCIAEAISLATEDVQTAESCTYLLAKGGKPITGPSVRIAEMIAYTFGNLHIGARIIDVGESYVEAQGVCWDMEKNVKIIETVRRSIRKKNGERFPEHMIPVICGQACSIALRNAVFRVVPRTYAMKVYRAAMEVAAGNAKTLDDRRRKAVARFNKEFGISQKQVLDFLGKPKIEDVVLHDIEVLVGLYNAIASGGMTAEQAFEHPAPIKSEVKPEDLKPKPPEETPPSEGEGEQAPYGPPPEHERAKKPKARKKAATPTQDDLVPDDAEDEEVQRKQLKAQIDTERHQRGIQATTLIHQLGNKTLGTMTLDELRQTLGKVRAGEFDPQ